MLHSIISQAGIAALILTCAFAFARGGAAERWGAAIIAFSWVGSYIISFALHDVFSDQIRELTFLMVDALLSAGLLFLAFRFAKLWLGFAMLMLSGELALHGAAMGDWGFQFQKYIFLNNALSFGLLALLAFATVLARRSEKGAFFNYKWF